MSRSDLADHLGPCGMIRLSVPVPVAREPRHDHYAHRDQFVQVCDHAHSPHSLPWARSPVVPAYRPAAWQRGGRGSGSGDSERPPIQGGPTGFGSSLSAAASAVSRAPPGPALAFTIPRAA